MDRRWKRIDIIKKDKQREKVLMGVAVRSLLAEYGIKRDVMPVAAIVVMFRLFMLFASQLNCEPAVAGRTVGMVMMRDNHAQQHDHTGKQHYILIHLLSHRLLFYCPQK